MSSIIASSAPPAAVSTPDDRARGVVERLDAHRLGEPAGRVDGEHDDLAPALGRAQRERRRGGGLADAARAAADDDPGARVVEQRVDVERGGRRRRRAGRRGRGSRVRRHAIPCSLEGRGELVEAAEVDAARQPGQLVRRDVEVGDQRALGVLERPALGVVAGLARPARRPGRWRRPRRPPSGRRRIASWSSCPRSAAARSSASRSRGRTRFTTTPPTGSCACRSSAMPSAVSWTGISSSTVTRCTAVRGERNSVITVSAWLLIGPTLASPASSLLTLRNCVIRPVGGASSTTASYSDRLLVAAVALHGLEDLAGEQHVADAGRDGGGEVDHAEPVQRPAGAAELVVHREVLQQRRLGVDVQARTPRRACPRARAARWRSGAPRRAAGRRRTCGRCPGGPRPRRAARSCPWEASASASAAATVDLPVPPLPVTTCSRTRGQSAVAGHVVQRIGWSLRHAPVGRGSCPVHPPARGTACAAAPYGCDGRHD